MLFLLPLLAFHSLSWSRLGLRDGGDTAAPHGSGFFRGRRQPVIRDSSSSSQPQEQVLGGEDGRCEAGHGLHLPLRLLFISLPSFTVLFPLPPRLLGRAGAASIDLCCSSFSPTLIRYLLYLLFGHRVTCSCSGSQLPPHPVPRGGVKNHAGISSVPSSVGPRIPQVKTPMVMPSQWHLP